MLVLYTDLPNTIHIFHLLTVLINFAQGNLILNSLLFNHSYFHLPVFITIHFFVSQDIL